MATTTGGIAPATGDGIPLQGHLVGAGPPRNVGGEHQQPFMSPAGTVRQVFAGGLAFDIQNYFKLISPHTELLIKIVVITTNCAYS